jgi:hypothetical protein
MNLEQRDAAVAVCRAMPPGPERETLLRQIEEASRALPPPLPRPEGIETLVGLRAWRAAQRKK